MEGIWQTYTIKEVAQKIGVSISTIRQWENDFKGVLVIERNPEGARYYTASEIDSLKKIKEWRNQKYTKEQIRKYLLQKAENEPKEKPNFLPQSAPQLRQSEVVEALRNIQNFPQEMEAMLTITMEKIKEEIKNEVRNEIRNELKKEVVEEVRKEILNGSKTQQELLENDHDRSAKQIEILSKLINEMKELQENAAGENVAQEEVEQEVLSPKPSFFKRLFKK